jgi:hypothetical protein
MFLCNRLHKKLSIWIIFTNVMLVITAILTLTSEWQWDGSITYVVFISPALKLDKIHLFSP